jgi:two-component system chemotaxis response regulator CheB
VRTLLSVDERFAVVGEARNRAELLGLADRLHPAAVVLDPHLPHGALPALAELMACYPVPIVVYGDGAMAGPAVQAEMRAAGAIDVILRPARAKGPAAAAAAAEDLRACLLLASRIKVIRHPGGRLARPRQAPASDTATVVIGASTGGPTALANVLSELPGGLRAAVVVVQHMPAGFLSGLAGWLDGCCRLPVRLGADGELVREGEVLICPGGLDSVIEQASGSSVGRLRCRPPAPPAHHVPSVDRAFRSVAEVAGPRAIGVLLTGMGSDGAAGMAALKAAGGATLAQDESTSTIYGMPRAAAAAGAVDRILPLPEIAVAIVGLVADRSPERVRT